MKNLKKFENFDGFLADEEADQMKNDQIFADREAEDMEDAKAFAGEESQEEETLELDEVVDKLLATIDECGEDCDEEELKAKLKEVLVDFHNAEEIQHESEEEETEEDNFETEEEFGSDDLESNDEVQFEGLKKFSDFK